MLYAVFVKIQFTSKIRFRARGVSRCYFSPLFSPQESAAAAQLAPATKKKAVSSAPAGGLTAEDEAWESALAPLASSGKAPTSISLKKMVPVEVVSAGNTHKGVC